MKLVEDTRVIVLSATGLKGTVIPISETASVISKVGEVAYVLYSVYRTYPFRELHEISDEFLAEKLNWLPHKVSRYRLILEKADLLLLVRYGTKHDQVIRCFVGEEPVALHHAGLPANINNQQALYKLRKQLKITTTAELIKRLDEVVNLYQDK